MKILSITIREDGKVSTSSDVDTRWFRDLVDDFFKKVNERYNEKMKEKKI